MLIYVVEYFKSWDNVSCTWIPPFIAFMSAVIVINAVLITYIPAAPACGGRSSAGYCANSTALAVLPAPVHSGMVILYLIVNIILCGSC